MSDLFKLSGSYGTQPAYGSPSGVAALAAPLDESVTLVAKHYDRVDLEVDTPVSVEFGGTECAHILVMRTLGGKVKALLTSADGTQQIVPVDPLQILISRSVPISAIEFVRVAGVPTSVDIFLGQIS